MAGAGPAAGSCTGKPAKTWDFTGEERGWHNFLDHRFLRSALVPAWSAAEGGPGASSHKREDVTAKYLQRPCVMNPAGGPQNTDNTDIHGNKAKLTLSYVDLERRKEFHRRKYNEEIKQRQAKTRYNDEIKHNLGYPFNQGMLPRELKLKETEKSMDQEIMEKLHPDARETDFEKKWDRTPLGQITLKTDDEEDEHFHQWLGPIGWQDGYFEWRSGAPTTDLVVSDVAAEEDTGDAEGTGGEEGGAGTEGAKDETLSKTGSGDGVVSKTGSQTGSKVSQSKESKQKEEVEEGADPEGTKFVWHGPEEDPRWLDAFIWKPLNLVGPTAVKSAGATTTVNNFLMGRAKDPPKACLPKRNYLRTMTSVHAVTHKAVTVEYNDNVLAEANIHTTDWLTGTTMYKFDQRAQTRTSFATVDKKEMIKRKDVKKTKLEKAIADLDKEILAEKKQIQKVESKCLHKDHTGKNKPKMLPDMGRILIKEAEEKIQKLERQRGLLLIRLDQEEREIKALKHEVHVKHIARDLPLPKSLVMLMDPKDLQSMADVNYQVVNPIRQAIGAPVLREDPDAYVEEESEDEDGFNVIRMFLKDRKEQDAAGIGKQEKYFGQPLVVPATGVLNAPVVKKKNADTVLKYKEENKAVADVFLARTDGKPLRAQMDAEELKRERKARAKQQKEVDGLMAKILKMDPLQDLEAWAKSPARRDGVYGSSMFPASGKPKMQTFQTDDGQYMKYSGFVSGTDTGNQTRVECSSGKVVGAVSGTLIQRGEEMKEQMKGSLAVQVRGAKGPFESTFHTGYQDAGDRKKYQLQNWGPEHGDQWAIGKAFADTYRKQCRSAASGVTPNVAFAGGIARSEKLPDDHIASCSAKTEGPFRESLVEDRPFNGHVRKKA